MEELVAALLLLARMDDASRPTAGPVDLDDLVLAEARRLRHDGGPRVDVSGVSAGQVVGTPCCSGQVVGNLLSNALRHARDEVSVSLQEYDGEVVLTVDDDGNGIPPERPTADLRPLRATRRGPARDAGGSGLGLAIVHKVVEDLWAGQSACRSSVREEPGSWSPCPPPPKSEPDPRLSLPAPWESGFVQATEGILVCDHAGPCADPAPRTGAALTRAHGRGSGAG